MMEEENKTCCEAQVFPTWSNTIRLMIFSPWNKYGANPAQPKAFRDTGDRLQYPS